MVIPPVFASYSTNGFTATKELSTLVGCQGDRIGWRQESFMNGRKRYGGKWARRTSAGYDIPPLLIIGGTKFRGYARSSQMRCHDVNYYCQLRSVRNFAITRSMMGSETVADNSKEPLWVPNWTVFLGG